MGKISKLEKFYIEVMSSRLYNSISQRCKNKNRNDYCNYGGKGIKNHLTRKDIIFLIKRDKAWLLEKPTIDRKNVKDHYTVKNCEFIEKSINSQKDKFKPVNQHSLDGKLINKFPSIKEASRVTGNSQQNIGYCANGHCKTSAGFIWKLEGGSNE